MDGHVSTSFVLREMQRLAICEIIMQIAKGLIKIFSYVCYRVIMRRRNILDIEVKIADQKRVKGLFSEIKMRQMNTF